MVAYYQKRAREYEEVYEKPERQADLVKLKKILLEEFSNKNIIEIACGTGYWTQVLAENATSILATDINSGVLEIAEKKNYKGAKITFQQIDFNIFALPKTPFQSLFGGFIWSHISHQNLPAFLKKMMQQVEKGGELIFIDNKYVEGSSTPISRKDEFGNTFQKRVLKTGEAFEVVKNFPTEEAIQFLIQSIGANLKWIELDYYWLLKLRKK